MVYVLCVICCLFNFIYLIFVLFLVQSAILSTFVCVGVCVCVRARVCVCCVSTCLSVGASTTCLRIVLFVFIWLLFHVLRDIKRP